MFLNVAKVFQPVQCQPERCVNKQEVGLGWGVGAQREQEHTQGERLESQKPQAGGRGMERGLSRARGAGRRERGEGEGGRREEGGQGVKETALTDDAGRLKERTV